MFGRRSSVLASASARAPARGGERRSRPPPGRRLSRLPTAALAPRAARTYVNHCMIIVRILDILMIVSRGGWSREWRGGVRAHPLISAAAARVILIP